MAVGRIRSSFGVRGDVKVTSYSGEFDHFLRFKSVSARKGSVQRDLTIQTAKRSGSGFLMKFVGIESPEAAKLLADHELWVPRSSAAPLKDGEVYFADLVGCSVQFEGITRGTITGFWDGTAATLLEVKTSDDRQVLIPFQDVYLGNIDLSGRTVELRVEWILE